MSNSLKKTSEIIFCLSFCEQHYDVTFGLLINILAVLALLWHVLQGYGISGTWGDKMAPGDQNKRWLTLSEITAWGGADSSVTGLPLEYEKQKTTAQRMS